MEASIAGRVKNMSVSTGKPLVPLFEAISNSIDAIQEANETNGHIDIDVIRDEKTLFAKADSSSDRQLAEIKGFIIRDNGIGFNERNYHEFNISDTTYKASSGGKGVGRFTWLKTFNQVKIESEYFENNEHKQRSFTFTLSALTGIDKHQVSTIPGKQTQTIVHLVDYKEKYRKLCPKRADIIAAYIIEEFLDVFVGASCPKISLRDESTNTIIDLDNFYDTVMVKQSYLEEIEIKGYQFSLIHVQLHSTHMSEHRIYLCAKKRAVKPEKLTGIPNLPPRIPTAADGEEFIYSVYVSSSLLNDAVNVDRVGFDIPEENSFLLADQISLSDIRASVKEHIEKYLAPYIEPLKKKKYEKIEKFIAGNGLMYRPIHQRLERAFDDIDLEASESDIDFRLYQEYQKILLELRKQGQELLESANKESTDYKTFEKRLLEHFVRITQLNQSDLARYVIQRKIVIEFLRKLLAKQPNDLFSNEEKLHNLICQRNSTSEDLLFHEHNLWLVDERLAFYNYLSSDKQIRTVPVLENNSTKEPDILIFDKAIAFSDTNAAPFSSVTIIEFKKPERNEYSEKENPITQVAEYVQDIKEGKAKYADGRSMPINPNIPFHSYIICTITPRLEKWAKLAGLEKSADALGYFGYMRGYGVYVEVISYEKLLTDTEKRNIAFFEKLGISARGR